MTKRKPLTVRLAVQCLIWKAEEQGVSFYCGLCRGALNVSDRIEFDHTHELADDGEDAYENLRPVHYDCHKKKSAKSTTQRAHIKRLAKGGRTRKGPKLRSRPFQKAKRPFRKPLFDR